MDAARGTGWPTYQRLLNADLTTLDTAERRLVALGGLRDEVNNGGFHQYFFNCAGDLAPDAMDAATEAGVNGLADLVRRAVDMLGSPYPVDRDARQQRLVETGLEPEAFEDLYNGYREIELAIDLDAVMDNLARRT
jgi:hypothetical protein